MLNLTGTGHASRRMEWPAAGLATHLGVVERNLAGENADGLMAGVEAGRVSRCVLPWVPLMAGGDDPGVISRWKAVAGAEPDSRARSVYAGLALVFADKVERLGAWRKELEGWNVTESVIVNEWIAQGEAKGKAKASAAAVTAVLEARFGTVPADVASAVGSTTELDRLRGWLTAAATAPTLDDFRRTAGV